MTIQIHLKGLKKQFQRTFTCDQSKSLGLASCHLLMIIIVKPRGIKKQAIVIIGEQYFIYAASHKPLGHVLLYISS